jgi:hypothetical protein
LRTSPPDDEKRSFRQGVKSAEKIEEESLSGATSDKYKTLQQEDAIWHVVVSSAILYLHFEAAIFHPQF